MVEEHQQLSVVDLKRAAKNYREQALGRGKPISHSEALEHIATLCGFRDWNTACAVLAKGPAHLRVGQRITGHYLGHSFQGELRGVESISRQAIRVDISLEKPIDVVRFSSFSAWRRRIRGVVGPNGRSIAKISTGQPHLIIDQMQAKHGKMHHGK